MSWLGPNSAQLGFPLTSIRPPSLDPYEVDFLPYLLLESTLIPSNQVSDDRRCVLSDHLCRLPSGLNRFELRHSSTSYTVKLSG